jgi:hypothetical protein
MNFYCLRCRLNREIEVAFIRQKLLKSGRLAYCGHCPVCGCKVVRLEIKQFELKRENA